MKFGTKGFIKTFCYQDLCISGFIIKLKVYGPSLRSAVYRRPTLAPERLALHQKENYNHTKIKINFRKFSKILKIKSNLNAFKITRDITSHLGEMK